MAARRYCFTWFVDDEDIMTLDAKLEEIRADPRVRGMAGQLEECPTTKRLHLQGYIELTQPVRMAGMKKLLGDHVHLAAAKGTRHQNVEYVNKKSVTMSLPYIFFK